MRHRDHQGRFVRTATTNPELTQRVSEAATERAAATPPHTTAATYKTQPSKPRAEASLYTTQTLAAQTVATLVRKAGSSLVARARALAHLHRSAL